MSGKGISREAKTPWKVQSYTTIFITESLCPSARAEELKEACIPWLCTRKGLHLLDPAGYTWHT